MQTTNKTLLKGGCVLTLDAALGNFRQADVLLDGSTIAAIAPVLDVEDCQVIDASGMIVLPGLVDTHRHLWETPLRGLASDWTLMQYLEHILGPLAAAYRPEDVYVGNLLGSLEAINAGITTVFDWSHIMNSPEHTDQAIQGLHDAGIRAVFGYGTPGTGVWEWFYESQRTHPRDVERVQARYFSSQDQRLTLALAIRGPEYSTFPVSRQDIALARELQIPVSMHVGCGNFGPRYQAIAQLYQAGLLGPDLNFAHCNSLSAAEFTLLADHGCSVSITPEVEMQMNMGFPATGKALTSGLRPGLGVDVVSAAGGDLFGQMKFALQTERAFGNAAYLQSGERPERLSLSVHDALRMATIDGAHTLNLERKMGSLTPGKQADVIMLDAQALNLHPVSDPVAAVVLSAHAGNVDSVFVAGKPLKRNGQLLGWNLPSLRARGEATRQYLLKQTPVPKLTVEASAVGA